MSKVFRCIVLGVLLSVGLGSAHAVAPIRAAVFSINLTRPQRELRRLREELEKVDIGAVKRMNVESKLTEAIKALQAAQGYLTK